MESTLKQEFEYYIANQAEIVAKYNGRFVVIKDRRVIGDFPDLPTAVSETSKQHQLGTFLVQKAEPGDRAYSQTFTSRVAFTH